MTEARHIGFERQDGHVVGRDPGTISADELERLGHARVSPLRALRLKCLDCCNDSAQEAWLCTALDCPGWPFRMGKNPWTGPVSEACREHGRRLGLRRAAHLSDAFAEKEDRDGSPLDGGKRPEDDLASFRKSETDEPEGGRT